MQLSVAKSLATFFVIYLVSTFLLIPLLSQLGDRRPLPIFGKLRPLTFWTIALNRHYVNTELKDISIEIANQFSEEYPGSKINYLDANFPFFRGFPLPPHLSHDDGKKLDLAFSYFKRGERSNSAPSIIGYGVYESPMETEINYPDICQKQGYWQYGFIGNLIPKWDSEQYVVDQERTSFIINELLAKSDISKIFIEPHLKQRWGFDRENKIRFHGCQAVRHDDHIHFQIK